MSAEDGYATLAVLLIDLDENIVRYYDFGHTRVLLRRAARVMVLPKGEILGGSSPFFGMEKIRQPKPVRFRAQAGDHFCMYSDGITEQKNMDNEESGESGVALALLEARHMTMDSACAYLREDWLRHAGAHRIQDDSSQLQFTIY